MVKQTNSKSRGEGKRVANKKVDFRTRKAAIGSKRKLARFGKRQTTGHVGASTQYMARTKALRVLQITLKDFRRLCILKGIYPRDPTKKPEGKQSTTYYSVKDIAFLAHEPILAKFREMKAVSKRIARSLGRKENTEAQRVYKSRPKYSLDHLVKERYPTFVGALGDLDDGLSLIHLFASLPATLASKEHSEKCVKLAREWQFFVSRAQVLRKAFVSMKGLYYQVEIQGTAITWLVPHKFSQDVAQLKANKEIDFRVMKTFLEFYETLLEFVLFKLYRETLGLAYPPALDSAADHKGNFLSAMKAVEYGSAADEAVATGGNPKKKQRLESTSALGKLLSETASLLVNQGKTLSEPILRDKAEEEESEGEEDGEEEESEESEEEEEEVGKDFVAESEEMKAIHNHSKELERTSNLFKGLHFYLGREVPVDSLELCITSFGGAVTREDLCSNPATAVLDKSITHHVTDRNNVLDAGAMAANREYIQPQWVYDSLNNKMLLPVADYALSVTNLPPHLSPFVDDELEGYKPKRAEEIELLRLARAGGGGTEAVLKKSFPDTKFEEDEDDSSSSEEEDEEEEEEQPVQAKTAVAAATKAIAKAKATTAVVTTPAVALNDNGDADDDEELEDSQEEESEEEKEEEDEDVVIAAKPNAGFMAATSFQGARPGYYFRFGQQGLGYYRDASTPLPSAFNAAKDAKQHDKQVQKNEVVEAKEMRTIMMSKKAKHLYERMQHGITQKKEKIAKLESKRKA